MPTVQEEPTMLQAFIEQHKLVNPKYLGYGVYAAFWGDPTEICIFVERQHEVHYVVVTKDEFTALASMSGWNPSNSNYKAA